MASWTVAGDGLTPPLFRFTSVRSTVKARPTCPQKSSSRATSEGTPGWERSVSRSAPVEAADRRGARGIPIAAAAAGKVKVPRKVRRVCMGPPDAGWERR